LLYPWPTEARELSLSLASPYWSLAYSSKQEEVEQWKEIFIIEHRDLIKIGDNSKYQDSRIQIGRL
jgi:hypothetical protein